MKLPTKLRLAAALREAAGQSQSHNAAKYEAFAKRAETGEFDDFADTHVCPITPSRKRTRNAAPIGRWSIAPTGARPPSSAASASCAARAGAMLRKAHTIPLNLLFGAGWMLGGVIAAPFSKAWFRSMVLEGSKKLAESAGRAAALLGHCPQPYRTIHGA